MKEAGGACGWAVCCSAIWEKMLKKSKILKKFAPALAGWTYVSMKGIILNIHRLLAGGMKLDTFVLTSF